MKYWKHCVVSLDLEENYQRALDIYFDPKTQKLEVFEVECEDTFPPKTEGVFQRTGVGLRLYKILTKAAVRRENAIIAALNQ